MSNRTNKALISKLPGAVLILLTTTILSCGNESSEADAWGNFEATETVISSPVAGEILQLPVKEGSRLDAGEFIGLIDTTTTWLQVKELMATRESVRSKIATINSQTAIFEQQIKNLNLELERVKRMLEDGAATQKQFDDLSGQIEVLRKQVSANSSQKLSVAGELSVLDARHELLKEALESCRITAPVKGTVTERYAEPGEITAPGRPLIRLADLQRIKLKVYVSGADLADVITGNSCRVRIDGSDDSYIEYPGTIIAVSDRAEFTPKIIQTKEERVSLVYAVTIEVENDGRIKSGMPGEAIF